MPTIFLPMSSMARRYAMHHAPSFVLTCSSHGLKTPLRLTTTARVAESLPEDYKSDRLRSPTRGGCWRRQNCDDNIEFEGDMLLARLFRKVLVVWNGGCTCRLGMGF